jgi:hypothetical protein
VSEVAPGEESPQPLCRRRGGPGRVAAFVDHPPLVLVDRVVDRRLAGERSSRGRDVFFCLALRRKASISLAAIDS